jgi:chromosome partitioning protein
MRNMLRQGLKRFIQPERTRYASGRREATVIAVSSQKGGVGKTTTSVCLGAALARFHGQHTLILDMDAQGHVEKSLSSHIVSRRGRLGEVLLSSDGADVLDAVADTALPGLHITGADHSLNQAESLMSTKIGKEFLLRDALTYTRTHYDVIVIDCPPNLGTLTLNALCAADYVLVPCDASPLAIQGVNVIVDAMMTINERLNRGLDLLGVVLTRVDARNTTVNQAALDALRGRFGDLVLDNQIGVNTSLSKAQFEGVSLVEYAPQSRAARDYRQLSDEARLVLRERAPRAA